MDVHCSTCNEPWDVYHVRHDAIFETNLSREEAEAWSRLPTSQQLTPNYRGRFKAAGWEFGRSILNVIHCPCCPPGAIPDPERLATKRGLEQLFGDDEDGLAATLEDYGL
jgi:hypothetical protein